MGEDGNGLVKEEREAWLEGDPFVFIDLDGELLCAPAVTAVWEATLCRERGNNEFFLG